jgi:hypothetical protein
LAWPKERHLLRRRSECRWFGQIVFGQRKFPGEPNMNTHHNHLIPHDSMSASQNVHVSALQLFESDANPVYALAEVERLTRVSQRKILRYCKQGLVAPVQDPERDGVYFDGAGVQALRRIEHWRADFGINLGGIKWIFDLTNEVERLQSAVVLRPPLPDD